MSKEIQKPSLCQTICIGFLLGAITVTLIPIFYPPCRDWLRLDTSADAVSDVIQSDAQKEIGGEEYDEILNMMKDQVLLELISKHTKNDGKITYSEFRKIRKFFFRYRNLLNISAMQKSLKRQKAVTPKHIAPPPPPDEEPPVPTSEKIKKNKNKEVNSD